MPNENSKKVDADLISAIEKNGAEAVLRDVYDWMLKVSEASLRDSAGLPLGAPVTVEVSRRLLVRHWDISKFATFNTTSPGMNLYQMAYQQSMRMLASDHQIDEILASECKAQRGNTSPVED